MTTIDFISKCDVVDVAFSRWFNGQNWDEQEKFLSKQIADEFKISKKDLKEIFGRFHSIFPQPQNVLS